MNNKILHLMILDKFNVPFIDFIVDYFDISYHRFIFLQAAKYEYGMTKEKDVIWIDKKYKVLALLFYMYKTEKIIIHGLWSSHLILLLFLQPWLLRKCYWVMWGGDFYFPETQSWIKRYVIKRMGYLVTGNRGDYEYAVKYYNSIGTRINSFVYPSNLYKEYYLRPKQNSNINILLGNSADPTNHHIEVLQNLEKYKNENIQIFAPLSYGDDVYAKDVMIYGHKLFGNKFIALTDFMPLNKYIEFLSEIDIAIFNHRRQQAFGTIICLIGIGKKVYLHPDSTINIVMKEHNLKVFDTTNIMLTPIDYDIKELNIANTKKNYSKEVLITSLSSWFFNQNKENSNE